MAEYETDFLKDTLLAIQRAQAASLAEGIKIGRRESAAKIAELEKACAELGANSRRYEKLRDADGTDLFICWKQHGAVTKIMGDSADIIVDAALSAERAGGETE